MLGNANFKTLLLFLPSDLGQVFSLGSGLSGKAGNLGDPLKVKATLPA